MTSLEYLRLDLTRPTTLTNAAQIGCPVSADSSNAVATLTALSVKYICTTIARSQIRRIGRWVTHDAKDGDRTADEDDTGANCASESACHSLSILGPC